LQNKQQFNVSGIEGENMLKDFNFLATTYRCNERAACSELQYLLQQAGDSEPITAKTGVSGLIAARSILKPIEAIEKLRESLHARPYEFRYMLRIIPIEKVVPTDLNEIASAITDLGSKIGSDETFRVTVEKRFTTISSDTVIRSVAEGIKRRVDLSKPDKILLIEIVGKLTGVSVITPKDILSIMKEKML
jgi:tRNA acetyltransferase TAN1